MNSLTESFENLTTSPKYTVMDKIHHYCTQDIHVYCGMPDGEFYITRIEQDPHTTGVIFDNDLALSELVDEWDWDVRRNNS